MILNGLLDLIIGSLQKSRVLKPEYRLHNSEDPIISIIKKITFRAQHDDVTHHKLCQRKIK